MNSSYENIAKVDGGGIYEDIASSIGRMGGLVQVQQSGDGIKTDAATSPTRDDDADGGDDVDGGGGNGDHAECKKNNVSLKMRPIQIQCSNRTNNTH